MKLGVSVLPKFNKDTTDRNRTSPFAFTGNKFEFRMLGSSESTACANIMLNTAVAEILRQYADELENADNFDEALHALIQKTIKEHKNILFNGDGYDEAWIKEATEKRGLLNLKTTVDAIEALKDPKNRELLSSHKVMSDVEMDSRYEIMLENYNKSIIIEANTMIDMANKEIIPAGSEYSADVASAAAAKMAIDIPCLFEKKRASELTDLIEAMEEAVLKLEDITSKAKDEGCIKKQGEIIRDEVLPAMAELRIPADEAEKITAESYWPFPTYGDLLFYR